MPLLAIWLFVGGLILGMFVGRSAARAEKTEVALVADSRIFGLSQAITPLEDSFSRQLMSLQIGLGHPDIARAAEETPVLVRRR